MLREPAQPAVCQPHPREAEEGGPKEGPGGLQEARAEAGARGRLARPQAVADRTPRPRQVRGCGRVTEAPSLYEDGVGVAVRGTSLGPVLASRAVQMWEKHVSTSGIADILNDAFGIQLGRAAAQGALAAAAHELAPAPVTG